MIPVEAVEAVTDALWKKYSAQGPVDAQRWRTIMEDSKLALEAAAPHMMAGTEVADAPKAPSVISVPRSAVTNLYRTTT